MPRLARILSACVLLFGVSMPVRAAEVSAYDVIGYSADARYFAFSEYGVQDGSGFPYATVFIVNLDNDTFAGGPYRIVSEDETASLADTLGDALSDASGRLAELGIRHPARLVAADPPTEIDDNQRAIRFHRAPLITPIDQQVTLQLTTFPLPGPSDCQSFGPTVGFQLDANVDGQVRQVYRDNSIPKSRHCPLDYQMSGVWMPMSDDLSRAVAIISVIKVGFEGPDRRIIAVPVSF